MRATVIFIFIVFTLSAFSRSKLDPQSLEDRFALVPALENNIEKVEFLNKLAWDYHRIDIEKSFLLASKSELLSDSLNYKKGHARALGLIANYHSYSKKEILAVKYYQQSLDIGVEIQDSFIIASAYNNLAGCFAIIPQKMDDAIEFYYKALEWTEAKDTFGIVITNLSLGELFWSIGKDDLKKKHFDIAYEIADKSKDHTVLTESLSMKAEMYYWDDRLDDALVYYYKSMEHAEANHDDYSLIYLYYSIGLTHYYLKNFDASLEAFNSALTIIDTSKVKYDVTSVLLDKAELYFDHQYYRQAKEIADEAFNLAATSLDTSYFYDFYARYYAYRGDFNKAYAFSEKYNITKDSINEVNTLASLSFLDDYQELKEEANFIKSNEQEQKMKLKRQREWLYFLVISLGLLSVLVFFILKSLRDRKKSQISLDIKNRELNFKNKELKRYIASNTELQDFAHIASHDLKSPIRTVTSFLGLLRKRENIIHDQTSIDYIDYVDNAARQMNLLINDLLEYSKLNSQKINLEEVSPVAIIEEVKSAMTQQILEKGAEIEIEEMPDYIIGDKIKLKQVFQNLIGNAIKFTSPDVKPHVDLVCRREGNSWTFEVKDNGIGIPTEYRKEVFKSFAQLNSKDLYAGSGLGLSITKKIIDQHQGKIFIKNNHNKGSRFIFSIPDPRRAKKKGKQLQALN